MDQNMENGKNGNVENQIGIKDRGFFAILAKMAKIDGPK